MNLQKLRKYAQPGDIVLVGGSGFISKLIKNAQRKQTPDGSPSRWSHVMIYINESCVAESTIDLKPYGTEKKRLDNGVQYNSLSNFKDTKDGMLLHLPLKPDDRLKLTIKAQAMIECGFRYSILGLIGSYFAFWVFPWLKWNPFNLKHSLYCSAFVQEVYRIIGIDFDLKHTSKNTSPEIISQYDAPGVIKIDLSQEGGEEFEPIAVNDVDEQRFAHCKLAFC